MYWITGGFWVVWRGYKLLSASIISLLRPLITHRAHTWFHQKLTKVQMGKIRQQLLKFCNCLLLGDITHSVLCFSHSHATPSTIQALLGMLLCKVEPLLPNPEKNKLGLNTIRSQMTQRYVMKMSSYIISDVVFGMAMAELPYLAPISWNVLGKKDCNLLL